MRDLSRGVKRMNRVRRKSRGRGVSCGGVGKVDRRAMKVRVTGRRRRSGLVRRDDERVPEETDDGLVGVGWGRWWDVILKG